MSLRSAMRYMNPYDLHKRLINEYFLKRPGDTRLLQRDTSKDKRDIDVIKENLKFLWEDSDKPQTWEEEFAKKYYDKLFKEYCIGDLSRYKENKIALRWRIEQEVMIGKGQFICGNKICEIKEELKSWEVNFAYVEKGVKKNVLVKIRLCPNCSKKLNYRSKKREIKRLKRRSTSKIKSSSEEKVEGEAASSSKEIIQDIQSEVDSVGDDKIEDPNAAWEQLKPIEIKSRDEEMEEYLEDLLL